LAGVRPEPLWDVHTHCYSREYLALLEQHGRDYRIARTADGYPHIAWRGISVVTLHPGTYDVEFRFRDPRQSPVGVHLISTTVPNVYPFPAVVQERAARLVNDDVARWRDCYPERLRGLASLPMDSDGAVAEVDRALDGLGLSGFIIGTHIGARDLDDPVFAPIFHRLDDRAAAVLLHPMVPERDGEHLRDHDLLSLVGFIADITECVMRLTLGGFFARYSRIRFILPQMGGAALWVRGRVRFGWPASAPPLPEGLPNLYYDTLAFQPEAIATAVQMVGADRLLFGSDYPHLGNAEAVWGHVKAANLGADAEAAIGWANAARVFA
jgi:aminocarboxymuconate-semialdehyde decarboxylase